MCHYTGIQTVANRPFAGIERDNGELVRQWCGPCLLPCLRVDIHTPVNAVCVARACIAVSLHTHLCVCVCVARPGTFICNHRERQREGGGGIRGREMQCCSIKK